jgi:DNA primase
MYYWNSKGVGGNGLDYLTRHCNMSFATAVEALTNAQAFTQINRSPTPAYSHETATTFSFHDIEIAKDLKRGIAYLTKTRAISSKIVQYLIDNKLFYMEAHRHNIIFPWYDENGDIVGADRQGSNSFARYKGIAKGSKYGYGFNIAISKPLKYALFFESVIDLLSYWQMSKKPLNGCMLVSMGGLKDNVMECMTKAFGNLQPVLCVDNDEAGKEFATNNRHIVARLPPNGFKDWNDVLRNIQQKE